MYFNRQLHDTYVDEAYQQRFLQYIQFILSTNITISNLDEFMAIKMNFIQPILFFEYTMHVKKIWNIRLKYKYVVVFVVTPSQKHR